jgi:hypothetical protein
LNTRPKAAAVSKRFVFLNRRPLLLVNPEFCFVVVAVALRRQLRTAFGAAALEDETPGFRRHSGTKSVCACALDSAGLKCAFHGFYLNQQPGQLGRFF